MGFELRFSDKEVTAWGGLAVMKQMLDHLDFAGALKRAQLPQPGSNRGYRPEQVLLQFIMSFWCGANRFAHNEITRHDTTLGKLFGITKMANHQAITRLFQRFSQPDNDRVFVSHTPTPSNAANGEFDDIVVWISPNILFSRMVAAGQLP